MSYIYIYIINIHIFHYIVWTLYLNERVRIFKRGMLNMRKKIIKKKRRRKSNILVLIWGFFLFFFLFFVIFLRGLVWIYSELKLRVFNILFEGVQFGLEWLKGWANCLIWAGLNFILFFIIIIFFKLGCASQLLAMSLNRSDIKKWILLTSALRVMVKEH